MAVFEKVVAFWKITSQVFSPPFSPTWLSQRVARTPVGTWNAVPTVFHFATRWEFRFELQIDLYVLWALIQRLVAYILARTKGLAISLIICNAYGAYFETLILIPATRVGTEVDTLNLNSKQRLFKIRCISILVNFKKSFSIKVSSQMI